MRRIANPASAPWRTLKAQALARLGRWRRGASRWPRTELAHARVWGAPGTLGRGAAHPRHARARGRPRRTSRRRSRCSTGSPARLRASQGAGGLGSALRRGRRPTDAREPLRRALELADICGADGAASSTCAPSSTPAASRPRTTALTGVEALTASERRVVTLAADGQTNRDIAQALFVTPKTVEVHLSSAYRKLGVRSRRELAGALAGADGA